MLCPSKAPISKILLGLYLGIKEFQADLCGANQSFVNFIYFLTSNNQKIICNLKNQAQYYPESRVVYFDKSTDERSLQAFQPIAKDILKFSHLAI